MTMPVAPGPDFGCGQTLLDAIKDAGQEAGEIRCHSPAEAQHGPAG